MLKLFFYSTIFFLLSQMCVASGPTPHPRQEPSQKPIETQKLTYDILTEGKKIGQLTHRIMPTEQGYTIAETSEIKLLGWWGKINIYSNFIETYDNNGGLIISDNKIRDGSTTHNMATRRNENSYLGSYQKVQKTTKNELAILDSLSELIRSNSHVDSEEVHRLFEKLFVNRTQKSQEGSFPTSSFDTTFTYLPFFLQKHAQDGFDAEVTLYDPEELELSTVKITDMGWEILEIKGKPIKTRLFSVNDNENPKTHIWLGNFFIPKKRSSTLDNKHPNPTLEPPNLIPYLVRLTAEDKDGPIEILLSTKNTIMHL